MVRALQVGGQFKVRALTRNPGQHRELADEVVEADLDPRSSLSANRMETPSIVRDCELMACFVTTVMIPSGHGCASSLGARCS